MPQLNPAKFREAMIRLTEDVLLLGEINAELIAACKAALPALEQAERELGGSGYFASKGDELKRAIARAEEPY